MVTVNLRLSEVGTVSLRLDTPTALEEVLQRCIVRARVELGGYIAIRNRRVITGDTLVGDDDEIDVFPAISGG